MSLKDIVLLPQEIGGILVWGVEERLSSLEVEVPEARAVEGFLS